MSSANPGLAYEDTPPLSAPLRFFLTAPLFGLVAGLVLLFDGDLLASRWTPGALAVVHLFAAGFMLHVMLGALLQILPVVAGAAFPAPLRIAGVTHVLLGLGAAGLAFGLGSGTPFAIIAGAVLLAAGLGLFLAASLLGLARAAPAQGASRTPRDLRLALGALALTTVLGVVLAVALGQGLALPIALPTLVDLHAIWAWMGWGGLLLAATSWVVVPMFQITPAYPAGFTRSWAPATLVVLVLWSASLIADIGWLKLGLSALLLALAGGFALQTVKLQRNSRRSTPDAPFRAFRLSMIALLGSLVALLVSLVHDASQWPILAGVLVLHGTFAGAISAMLYKIVPFLTWLNLTQARVRAPNMKKLLPDGPIRKQLRLHAAALGALILAVLLPAITPLAGLLVAVEFGWLLANLLRAVRAWHQAANA
ncbi:hypothetical protein CKCBHOJB_01576 [Thauera sp. GDN1]|uniref:hypothetical protein n=1 Tax=Thauera sp. GDN1 TaxID=2944810 RepID=UPI00247906EB|nr:hypothetical protein [Thauera sp. GDN1]WEN41991.1 hypothetical protein CKCBHOJB_01576 [Thauera sp. GDN1]